MEYIREIGKVSKNDILINLGYSEGQIKYALKSLKEEKMIEKVGKFKNTCYIIKER